jgi:hypothetical protein
MKIYFAQLKSLVTRASQTYLTGYFVFQMQQPICFHLLGAAASAKLGFTQSIANFTISLASIWLMSAFPQIANAVALSQFDKAKLRFKRAWTQGALVALAGILLAVIIWYALHYIPRFQLRLMTFPAAGVLFGSFLLQALALNLTYWPRAFKVEPFVKVAYMQMFVTPIALWFGATYFGLLGISLALMVSWISSLAGIFPIFWRFWQKRSLIPAPVWA